MYLQENPKLRTHSLTPRIRHVRVELPGKQQQKIVISIT